MDIEGLGESTVKTLLEQSFITKASDLFSLDTARLAALPGFGTTSAGNLAAAIDNSRGRPLPKFLFALGREGKRGVFSQNGGRPAEKGEQEEAGNPRFGCVWELGVSNESSPNGPYYNFDVNFVVVAPDEIYAAAQAAFDTFFGDREAA